MGFDRAVESVAVSLSAGVWFVDAVGDALEPAWSLAHSPEGCTCRPHRLRLHGSLDLAQLANLPCLHPDARKRGRGAVSIHAGTEQWFPVGTDAAISRRCAGVRALQDDGRSGLREGEERTGKGGDS